MHVVLENGSDLHVNERQKIRYYRGNWRIKRIRIRRRNGDFLLRAARTKTALLWQFYTLILLKISLRTRWSCLKCVIVYLARDIRTFVMYCVNEKRRSSLLIESTDSMILQWTGPNAIVSYLLTLVYM